MSRAMSGIKYYISDQEFRFFRIVCIAFFTAVFSAGLPPSAAGKKVSFYEYLQICRYTSPMPDDGYDKWVKCLQEKFEVYSVDYGAPTASEMAAAIVKIWSDTIDLHRLRRSLDELENENGKRAYDIEEIRSAVKKYEDIPAGNQKDELADILSTIKDVYAIGPENDTGKWKEKINKAFRERRSPPGAEKMAEIINGVWKNTITQEALAERGSPGDFFLGRKRSCSPAR